jgi:hypothetical protein
MPSCLGLGTAQPYGPRLIQRGSFTKTATAKMSQADHVSYHMTLSGPFFLLLDLCMLCGEGPVSSAGVVKTHLRLAVPLSSLPGATWDSGCRIRDFGRLQIL